jgi:hypothetical protein
MKDILAIDPGPEKSGWVIWTDGQIGDMGHDSNEHVLAMIELLIQSNYLANTPTMLVQEMIASYGMAVGASVFETCTWIGRFEQHFMTWAELKLLRKWTVRRLTRPNIKLHLCGTMRARDPNVRQALIDRLGPVGTKTNPGPLYGVRSHVWSALAVAITAQDTLEMQ